MLLGTRQAEDRTTIWSFDDEKSILVGLIGTGNSSLGVITFNAACGRAKKAADYINQKSLKDSSIEIETLDKVQKVIIPLQKSSDKSIKEDWLSWALEFPNIAYCSVATLFSLTLIVLGILCCCCSRRCKTFCCGQQFKIVYIGDEINDDCEQNVIMVESKKQIQPP